MFLLMYALFLVMNHPMKNFNANIMVMSNSATCGQEMALNKTKELAAAAAAPMQSKTVMYMEPHPLSIRSNVSDLMH